MKTIFFLIITIFFVSCQKKTDVKELLIGQKGYKYWQIDNNIDNVYDPYLMIHYFDKNNKWLVFSITPMGEFEMARPPQDVVLIKEWYLLSDTIIQYNGSKLKIEKITNDSLMLYSEYSKKYIYFIAVPDDLVPKEYRKILGNVSD